MWFGWKQCAWIVLLAVASQATAQTHIQTHARPARPSQPAARRPATPKIESDSELIVTDSAGAKQTYALPRVDWDWFVTPTDSHGLLRVMLNRGGGSHDQEVEFEWDGKRSTYTFTEATIRKDPRSSWQRFEVWLPKPDNNRVVVPKGGDAVTMAFTHLDDSEIEATFNGTTHLEDSSGPSSAFHVEGRIHLRRTGPHNEPNGGAWRDCDPIIHDKLVDEEGRWPSECEQKFDQYMRQGIARAMAPMAASLSGGVWKLRDEPDLKPIQKFARLGERFPYTFSYSRNFEYAFQLLPGSTLAAQIQQKSDQLNAQFKAAFQSVTPSATSGVQIHERTLPIVHQMAALGDLRSLGVSVDLNITERERNSYGSAPVITELPGGGTVITIAATRNDEENGPTYPMTMVLLGAWRPVTVAGSDVTAKGIVSRTAPRLAAQTLVVEFAGNPQAAAQAIQAIDWNALRQLMQ